METFATIERTGRANTESRMYFKRVAEYDWEISSLDEILEGGTGDIVIAEDIFGGVEAVLAHYPSTHPALQRVTRSTEKQRTINVSPEILYRVDSIEEVKSILSTTSPILVDQACLNSIVQLLPGKQYSESELAAAGLSCPPVRHYGYFGYALQISLAA